MAKETQAQRRDAGVTKNLGIRLPVSVIAEVKAEAAQRGITVTALFREIWAKYKGKK